MHLRRAMGTGWLRSTPPSTTPIVALPILQVLIALQAELPLISWQQWILPYVGFLSMVVHASLNPLDELGPGMADIGTMAADGEIVALHEK